MDAWLLSLDPRSLDKAAFGLFLVLLTLCAVWLAERQDARDRKAFFDAHPRLRDASNIRPHSVVEAVVMWDVERDVFVARCPEVSYLSGRGGTVDDACKALQKALYERAEIGILRRDMKVATTRQLEVYVAQDTPGADGSGAACASC